MTRGHAPWGVTRLPALGNRSQRSFLFRTDLGDGPWLAGGPAPEAVG